MNKPFCSEATFETRVELRLAFGERRNRLIRDWVEATKCNAQWAADQLSKDLQMLNDAELAVAGFKY